MDNQQPHIMVVEDDQSLAAWICDYLTDNGYTVTVANRGDDAIEMVKEDMPSLLILDINLPVKDGFAVCAEIREFYNQPVLMLTARGDESDEVQGLELGANDYLIKPVRPKALLARIQSLLKLSDPESLTESGTEKERVFGDFRIDAVSRSAYIEDELIDLSSHEFDLLWLLSENAGTVMSRDEMVGQLRGIEYDGFNRSVDILISRLRKKLGDDSNKPKKIKTVWGKGYVFAADAW